MTPRRRTSADIGCPTAGSSRQGGAAYRAAGGTGAGGWVPGRATSIPGRAAAVAAAAPVAEMNSSDRAEGCGCLRTVGGEGTADAVVEAGTSAEADSLFCAADQQVPPQFVPCLKGMGDCAPSRISPLECEGCPSFLRSFSLSSDPKVLSKSCASFLRKDILETGAAVWVAVVLGLAWPSQDRIFYGWDFWADMGI